MKFTGLVGNFIVIVVKSKKVLAESRFRMGKMIITGLQVKRFSDETSKLRGVATVTLDDMVVIHDIKILENDSRRFLAMPSKKMADGVFVDLVHPINRGVRSTFERLIFAGYEAALKSDDGQVKMTYSNSGDEAENLLQQVPEDFKIS